MSASPKTQSKKKSRFDDDILEQSAGVHDFLTSVGQVAANDQPREFDLDLIDEDADQPRVEFSEESMVEITESIDRRGVKTPISLRTNPAAPERFIINHGARRFRGSKRAGKRTIPGFIDEDYSDDDQVVENVQRDNLKPREVANYIGRKLAQGKKKGEIAKLISKSGAYVTQHAALLDLPDPIAAAFNTGRIADVTVINELVTAFKKSASSVERFLEDPAQEITRGSVKLLREFIDTTNGSGNDGDGNDDDHTPSDTGNTSTGKKANDKPSDPNKFSKAIVKIEYHGQTGRILLNKRPSEEGMAWLKYDDSGEEFEAELKGVKVLALVEG